MYCRSVFALLSLFAAVVTSQDTPGCINARTALRANQNCFNEVSVVLNVLDFDSNITLGDSGLDLKVFCAADCRNLVNLQTIACRDDGDGDDSFGGLGPAEALLGLTRVICSTDTENNVNCIDVIDSPRIETLNNAFVESGVCPDEIPDGQTCSSACQRALQNFVIDGGCCINLLFDAASTDPDSTFNGVSLSQCPVDLSQGRSTCTEIGVGGGAPGLNAFGGVLLFAVIIAVTVPGYI